LKKADRLRPGLSPDFFVAKSFGESMDSLTVSRLDLGRNSSASHSKHFYQRPLKKGIAGQDKGIF